MNVEKQKVVPAIVTIWTSVTSAVECMHQEVGFHQALNLSML